MTDSLSCKNVLPHPDLTAENGAPVHALDGGVADLGASNPRVGRGRAGLRELQRQAGGQFVEFSGHSTPVRYADGIIKEHLHTRSAAGLFDVSHMNQVRVVGAGAAQALEALLPVDLVSLPVGRMRYTVFTNTDGGILDDLIIARADEHAYAIVSNACRAQVINAWLDKHLGQRLSEHQGESQGGQAAEQHRGGSAEHRGEGRDGQADEHRGEGRGGLADEQRREGSGEGRGEGQDRRSDGHRGESQGGQAAEHRGEGRDERVRWRVVDDEVLLAIQGPQARAVVSALAPQVQALKPMHMATVTLAGYVCSVACAGYTGEDGFECSIPVAGAVQVAQALTASDQVRWCGLGARDSLRLEAGLCLYGSDIGEDCTPIEAGLGWTVARSRRTGGARAGGFAGADKILSQLDGGYDKLKKRLRGLASLERVMARQGACLYDSADDADSTRVGIISSGSYSPSLKCSIALAWLPASYLPGQTVYAHVRNRRIPFQINELPFYSTTSKKQ